MKLFSLFTGFIFLFISETGAQIKKFTISGYVEDAASIEKMIGAKVFVPALSVGAMTNQYGFFSLTIPEGNVKLVASYMGYTNWSTEFMLSKDTLIQVKMDPGGVKGDTVRIVAEQEYRLEEDPQMSSVKITVEEIKSLPAFMGEVDVIKIFQLMPGVQSGQEGSSNLIVRGGSPDQNLILLDGAPVYNVSHLFGFFSVFNADAIKNVELIKGGFPARYGGRASSVLDISMKDGNMKKLHGEISVGLIASKFTLEGPIIKDKTSFIVSARRTYLDLLYRPIIYWASGGTIGAGYYFYDVNAKVNHKFSAKDRLLLSFYNGNDKFSFKSKDEFSDGGNSYSYELRGGLSWGNTIAALRWNHLFTDKLFSNLTGTFSKYKFLVNAAEQSETHGPGINEKQIFDSRYNSGIRDFSLKYDFDFYPNPKNNIKFGAYSTYHKFTPGAATFKYEAGGTSLDTLIGDKSVNAFESGAYFEDDFSIGKKFRANAGFHFSIFPVNGKFYYAPQPRFSGRYLLPGNVAIKASWSHMAQYIHLLSNSNVGLPTDLWVPATDKVPFQRSRQVALGFAKSFPKKALEISLEGYYKWMDDIIDYKEGADFLLGDTDWQKNVEIGKGWSYGAELLIQKKTGKLTGWIGYTLAWTKRQFDNINQGRPYPYKYDRRHNVVFAGTFKFNEKVDIGAVWVYGSGNAITLPKATYSGVYPSIYPNYYGNYAPNIEYYGQKNSFRMQAYHRLDFSANFHKKVKRGERTWSISVYNVYSRWNPFFYYIGYQNNSNQRVVKKLSLFPIIPSFSWHFKF